MVNFLEKVKVHFLALFLNHAKDESYTPESLTVFAGTCKQDLKELTAVTLSKPQGWILLPLGGLGGSPLRCNFLQVQIDSNHQLGKDCHIRGVSALQILSKSHANPTAVEQAVGNNPLDVELKPWLTEEFLSYESLR